MSYSRTTKTSVSDTINVSYPASQSGGSRTVDVQIPVEITVHVDTNLYDKNVASCNRHIDLLTGAVVATEAAEISSKRKNAMKVGTTITSGFFSMVRSEISQQITELKTKVGSIILHLVQLKKGCVDKETQMASDFSRISSRYAKIFSDLDGEVVNRISALDEPTFTIAKTFKQLQCRIVENNLLGVISVGANESAYLQSILYASSVKQKAQAVILGANKFIIENYRQNLKFELVKFDDNATKTKYIPVIFTEFTVDKDTFASEVAGLKIDEIPALNSVANKVEQSFTSENLKWSELSDLNRSKLSVYFNNEMASVLTHSDTATDRIKEMMMSLWNNNKLNVLLNN